jgi:hypothetical protein
MGNVQAALSWAGPLLVLGPFLFTARQTRSHPGAGDDLDYSEFRLSHGSWARHGGGFHGRGGGFQRVTIVIQGRALCVQIS